MRKAFFILAAFVLLAGQSFAQGVAHRWYIPYTMLETVPATDVMLASTAITAEISSFGVGGIPMATADLAALTHMWPDEYHNKLYPVAARVIWTSDNAADDGSIDWLLSIEEKAFATEAPLEAATVALADDIAFAAETTTIQFGVQATNWDTLGVAAMATYNAETLVEIMVELNDEGDTTSDEVHLLGIEFFFVPRDFRGANFYVPGSTSQGVDHGIALPKRSGY